jgi:hypothetical protein
MTFFAMLVGAVLFFVGIAALGLLIGLTIEARRNHRK